MLTAKNFVDYGYAILFLLRLQRASLFLHPYPERCSGLYSYWGFAPSLLKCKLPKIFVTLPVFARNICCTISWAIHLVWGFAPQLYVSPTAIQYFDGGVIYN